MHFTSAHGACSALCTFLLAASTVSSLAMLPDTLRSSTPSIGSTNEDATAPELALGHLTPRAATAKQLYPFDKATTMEQAQEAMRAQYPTAALRYLFTEMTIELPNLNPANPPEARHVFTVSCWQYNPQDPTGSGYYRPWPKIVVQGDATLVIMADYDTANNGWGTFTGYFKDVEEVFDDPIRRPLGLTPTPVWTEKVIRATPVEPMQTGTDTTKEWVALAKTRLIKEGALLPSGY